MRALLVMILVAAIVDGAFAEDAARPAVSPSEALREQATQLRSEAERRFAEQQAACWQKFLVSDCREEAAQAHRNELARAHGLEREAHQLDLIEKKRQLAERDAQRQIDEPARAEAAAARAEKNRRQVEEARLRAERREAEVAKERR